MQYGFYIDMARCIGCSSCVLACMEWKDILPGQTVRYRRLTTLEKGKVPKVQLTNVSLSCMHCAEPACAAGCPSGAISKREEDGVVVVDQSKCIGCRTCATNCPFGAPQYGDDGLMQKCDLCFERLEQGLKPECVHACPVGAIQVGTMEELEKLAAADNAVRLAGTTEPSAFVHR